MTETERALGDDPVAQIVSALAANGFPRMPASVLMSIMTSEEGMLTAEQLAERLGASAAAISGAVRYLSTVGMIFRHRLPGTRRFAYELPAHAWYSASMEKTDLYQLIIRLAGSAVPTLGPRGAERVQEMSDFFAFLERRMPEVLAEWHQLQRRS
ncbi:MAG: MarR family transcriptional regulator [Rhodoglobus sp.]